MPATVIVGLQWGDEGKGKTTDFLAEQVAMVVRGLALALVAPQEPDDHGGGHQAGCPRQMKRPRATEAGTWIHISRRAPSVRRRG